MGTDDDIIDLRKHSKSSDDVVDEPEFKIGHIDEEHDDNVLEKKKSASNFSNDRITVKFDKFVNLVASHAYEEIFEKYEDEDIIVSTNLLTDLANSHDEKTSKKMPLVLLIGIVLGVGVAWIIFRP